ncbi:hypothetical protein [Rubrivirga sp.]|uniref:hypothetical protein n=1 Tax=Rubrivirga sp. TaxID=1885344 RepID=UPI003C781F31
MSDTLPPTERTDEDESPSSNGTQDDSAEADGSSQDDSDGSAPGEPSEDGSDEESGSDEGKNWLEWTITAVGAAVVLFVIGFLGYEWYTATDQPAELVVELGEITRDGDVVEVPVTVTNEGYKVAEAAVIEVCAGSDTCAQLTFAYVPFDSEVTGRVGLGAPLDAPLTSRVVSFRNP